MFKCLGLCPRGRNGGRVGADTTRSPIQKTGSSLPVLDNVILTPATSRPNTTSQCEHNMERNHQLKYLWSYYRSAFLWRGIFGVGVVRLCCSGVVQRINAGLDHDPVLNEGRGGVLIRTHAHRPCGGGAKKDAPTDEPTGRAPMSCRPSACPAAVSQCR